MRNKVFATAVALACMAAPVFAQAPAPVTPALKTRLAKLSGTPLVIVISFIPSEITSITCEGWTMLGLGSWHNQNEFTIPAGPAIAAIDAKGYQGYCKDAGSIIAHTDLGDAVGHLDAGAGKWNQSTKLTFESVR